MVEWHCDWLKTLEEMKIIIVFGFIFHVAASSVSGDLLTILPPKGTYMKFVGDAFYVSCESTGKNVQRVMWTGPDGGQITSYNASSKNNQHTPRIYVEEGNSGHRGMDLLFRNISKKDKGRYVCSANVDGTEAETSFELVVFKPISFEGTPKNQSLEEGVDSPLKCEVDADPMPRVSWKYNGKSIKVKMGKKFARHPDKPHWIIVKNATLADKGQYTCSAIQLTQKTSRFENFPVDVKVNHKPLASRDNMEESYSYVTGTVNLTCEAIAEPRANFTWLKDNVIITPSENVEIFDEDYKSILQLTVEKDNMFGDYYCKAENHLGTLERVVTLEKGEKPSVPRMEVKEVRPTAFRLSMASENDPRMAVVGFRVEYKKPGEEWTSAKVREFQAGKPYILDGLESDTLYVLRTSAKTWRGIRIPPEI